MAQTYEAKLIVEAENKTKAVLDQVNSDLGGMKSRLESMKPAFEKMAVAGTAVFGAIAFGAKQAIDAYQESERAEARLVQIAKQVTGATDEQIASYKELAGELQKIGVIEDDAIIAGQSQIASFTKSSAVVTELSDDLADLAVAQYGVDVSQDQMIQTANLLGKALTGQLGALTRTGILVSEDFKKAFEEANTEEERAAIISKIVQDNYGGLNKALRETSEGGVQALKNSFGDLMETLGGELVPILNDAVKKIAPVVASVSDWIKANPELTRNIIIAAAAISGIVAVIGLLGLALPAVITGFTILLGPIGVIGVAIAGLIFFVILLVKNWETAKETIIMLWEEATARISDVFENFKLSIAETLTALWNFIIQIFTDFGQAVLDQFLFWTENIRLFFNTMAEELKFVWQTLWDFFGTIAKFVWDSISNQVKNGFDFIKKLFIGAKDTITPLWQAVWDAIVQIVNSMVAKVKAPIIALIEWFKEQIERIKQLASSVGNAVYGAVGAVGGAVSSVIQKGQQVTGVQDAVITPDGRIVKTDPADYLIATKNPAALAGAGGQNVFVTINIRENEFVGEEGIVERIGNGLMDAIKQNIKL